MSLTADTADAIIAVDKALARFEQANATAANCRAYRDLKDAIETLQAVACGDGMHFDSVEDARQSRKPKPMAPAGHRWCVGGCGSTLPIEDGFRCTNCAF